MQNICKLILFGATALALSLPRAQAGSNFRAGGFAEAVRAGVSYDDQGICQFFTGPQDTLEGDEFLLTLGDHHSSDYDELQITGKFKMETDRFTGLREFRLFPDEGAAAEFLEKILRYQLGDPSIDIRLHSLKAQVNEIRRPQDVDEFICKVNLKGRGTGREVGMGSVSVTFNGLGQFFPAPKQSPAASGKNLTARAAQSGSDSCPLTQLAPAGLDPRPDGHTNCDTPNCLIDFKGYRWWTSFNYYGPPFEKPSYYWNANNVWSPRNAFVDGSGLHLFIRPQDFGNGRGPKWSSGEVVAMFKPGGFDNADLGYGDYLVTAQVRTAASWDQLDPNAVFGAFPYERYGIGGGRGGELNPYRELDLTEISHWGYSGPPNPGPTCTTPKGKPLLDPRLCDGNAQFTLQLWNKAPNNLHRYSIKTGVNTVTLVMRWHAAHQPVTFEQYDGSFTLASLPATPNYQWTTAAEDNPFVPDHACERFHLNLWMGNIPDAVDGINPPPAFPQEVVVANFEFKAFP